MPPPDPALTLPPDLIERLRAVAYFDGESVASTAARLLRPAVEARFAILPPEVRALTRPEDA